GERTPPPPPGRPGPTRAREHGERRGARLLHGVAATGEAGAEGAIVALQLRRSLLIVLLRGRLVLLLHLPPRVGGADEPADATAPDRSARGIAEHGAASGPEPRASEPAARSAR